MLVGWLSEKRNQIYLLLMGFTAAGGFIDWFIWQNNPPSMTLNDISQMFGNVVLCRIWQYLDSRSLQVDQSSLSKLITILIAPVGMAIYMFQSRKWHVAALSWLAFWFGLLMVIILTFELTHRLPMTG